MRFYFTILFAVFLLISNNATAQQKFTLSGYVKDSSNAEELIGASIFIEQLKTGITTNAYGFYSITLPEGNYQVLIQYLGYNTHKKTINLNSNQSFNITLNKATKNLQAVEINASRSDENIRSTQMSVTEVSIETIKKIPMLFGEVDIIRSLSMLPGVVSAGEGVGGFYVRGGSVDQNLVLLDEAVIYNASHLLGFFSVFNSDAVKDVKLYTGGIPAEYGGRISSILDVKLRDGNLKKFSGSGGVGLISSRILLEGPIKKDKASFVFSARRTYSDLLIKLARDPEIRQNRLYFYDLNGKINWKINDKNRIFFSSYFGRDIFKFTNAFRISWGNATATARWNHLFSEKIFSNLSVVFSDYQYELGQPNGAEAFNWQSKIRSIGLKYDFSHYLNAKNLLKYGIQTTYYRFFPGEIKPVDVNTVFNGIKVPNKNAIETALYISNEQKINDHLSFQYGLRYSTFSNIGKGQKFIYDNENLENVVDTVSYNTFDLIKFYNGLEPRFSARYSFLNSNAIKLSYMRTKQYLHLVSNSTVSSPLDIWIPCDSYIEPVTGDQIALGFFKNFRENLIETSVEGFYKNMQNIIDYKDNAELLLNNKIETQVLAGRGWSYGVEFLIRKNTGRITGWISYTLSNAQRQVEGINEGKKYSATFNRTHNINVVSTFQASARVDLSLTWTYNTGLSVTFPSGKFVYEGNQYPFFTERNGYRMPAYHRMDASCTLKRKNHETKKFYYEWNFSIYNLYARKNPFSITFQEENNKTVAYKIYLFSIVPSISWNFKF